MSIMIYSVSCIYIIQMYKTIYSKSVAFPKFGSSKLMSICRCSSEPAYCHEHMHDRDRSRYFYLHFTLGTCDSVLALEILVKTLQIHVKFLYTYCQMSLHNIYELYKILCLVIYSSAVCSMFVKLLTLLYL